MTSIDIGMIARASSTKSRRLRNDMRLTIIDKNSKLAGLSLPEKVVTRADSDPP